MKLDKNNSTEDNKNEQTKNKVINVENDKEVANEGLKAIAIVGIGALAAAIILGSAGLYIYLDKNNISKTTKSNVEKTYDITTDIVNEPKSPAATEEEETFDINQTEVDNNVSYTNINKFYRYIVESRLTYGEFAESFQSEDDVKNFVNFIHKFDELNYDVDSTIESKDEFDKIVADYYNSCLKHDIKGSLNILFEEYPTYKKMLEESENLAYDLKNGKGKDYTIANRYYTWMCQKLCDDRTSIDSTRKNAPLIEILRWQYEEYRNSGNMLNARKYQKNDSLPIDSVNIYYAEPNPEGIEVKETQNAYTCPDWGVDNVVSPTEEDTEVKLVIKQNGERLFKRVEENFDSVLNTRTR